MVKNKECPPDKILNPDTNRCVLKNGVLGKLLLKKIISVKPKEPKEPKEIKKTKEPKEPKELKEPKECPPDKILNPDTNRCVLKNGVLGKLLLKKLISKKPKETKEPKEPKETKKPKETKEPKETKKPKEPKKEPKEQNISPVTVKKPNLEFLTSMSNDIVRIEGFFNIQNIKAINEITNYIYTCFDNNKHQFNNENIKKFIKLCDTDIKSVCEKLIKKSLYVSLYDFLLIIKANVYNLISNYINYEDFETKTFYIYSAKLNDNNKWIILYIVNLIKYITNDNISIILINNNDEIKFVKPDDFVFFIDDCYYTGNELKNILINTHKKWNDNINFFVFVPYISNEAINVIETSFNKLMPKNSNLKFTTYKEIINPVTDIISDKEIKLLSHYYYGIDFSKNYMVYFDHNMVSEKLTLKALYTGIVANKKNAKVIKDKNLFKRDLLHTNDKFKNMDIVPIINNCNNYDCIKLMSTHQLNKLNEIIAKNNKKYDEFDYKKGFYTDSDDSYENSYESISFKSEHSIDDVINNDDNDVIYFKKKLEEKYGIPDKNKLNELINAIFVLFPFNHSFNKNAVKKFLDACEPEVKYICAEIIKETEHISYEKFLARLNSCICHLLYLHNNNRPLFIYLGNSYDLEEYKEKSNYWIYLYVELFIKYITNDKIDIRLITDFNHQLIENDMVVLIDDCIYSGLQMGSTIESIYNKNLTKLNFYLLVPFITSYGIEKIKESFKYNNFLRKSKLIFSKFLKKPKMVKDILSEPEVITLFKYYNNFMISSYNYIGTKSLIYFDHKVADLVSTITPFYMGIVPSKKNLAIIEKYKQEIKNKEYNYGLYNDDDSDDLYSRLLIIPIIKKCEHYTKKIKLMSPKCPAPPYKSSFIEFLNFIKSNNKKAKSLSSFSSSAFFSPIVKNKKAKSY
jgi:predicted phosphoribosyltransferase